MQLVTRGILFSHIPKTAGTSFRKSVGGYFHGWKVYSDYEGPNRITSEFIKTLNESGDYSRITEINNKKTLLAGHFHVTKYIKYYPVHRVVTFLREPAQRIISHYHDLQKRIDYTDTLEMFVREPRFQNVQTRFLDGIPVEAIGLAGICEYYKESIGLAEKLYALKVKEKRLNLNKKKKEKLYQADQALVAEIRLLNSADYELYNKAVSILLQRMELAKDNLPYVYAKTDSIKANAISGWAVNPDDAAPVKLELIVNGHLIKQIDADHYLSGLNEINIGRNGEVGFSHTFNEPLTIGDKVEVRVAGTNQLVSTSVIPGPANATSE